MIDRICKDFQHHVVDAHSFESALEHRGASLLLVEQDTRDSLAGLLSAAEAPSVGRVIIVTTRKDMDGDLRRLRRSGARYVIIRPPRIVDAEELRGRQVLIPRDAADVPLVTVDDLVAAVREAIKDDALMGVTIDVAPTGIAALEAAGAKPRIVAPWRATLGRWFGQRVLSPYHMAA